MQAACDPGTACAVVCLWPGRPHLAALRKAPHALCCLRTPCSCLACQQLLANRADGGPWKGAIAPKFLPDDVQGEFLQRLGMADVARRLGGSLGWGGVVGIVVVAAVLTLAIGFAAYHFRMRYHAQQQIHDIM